MQQFAEYTILDIKEHRESETIIISVEFTYGEHTWRQPFRLDVSKLGEVTQDQLEMTLQGKIKEYIEWKKRIKELEDIKDKKITLEFDKNGSK